MRNKYAVDPDDTSTGIRRAWWETLPFSDAEPYADKAWTYHRSAVTVEESCGPSPAEDPDNLDCEITSWWEGIGGEGPKPYEAAAWTYHQAVISVVEDACDEVTLTDGTPLDITSCEAQEWWAQIGGEGPKPYATATWTYHYDSYFIMEFVAVTTTELAKYDEGVFFQEDERVDFDAGLFGGGSPGVLIDGIYYLANQVGIEVQRTFAEIKVYDSLASSPGPLPTIPQPLGSLVTEPTGNGDTLLLDPSTLGDTGLGSDPYDVTILTDVPPFVESKILVQGGAIDGFEIEFDVLSTKADDVPPGTLLGQVNYEIFGQVVTVTSWEHYNWEDDTPIRKAVQAMINGLPSEINEVRVLDDPTAFWQSLGFNRAYKGDPYIHYFLG